METYVVDTHSLIWFIAEDDRLSWHAKQIFEKAEQVEVQILIPIIVLAEIAYIAQKKRVEITIDTILECIDQGDGFIIVPFDLPTFQTMLQLPSEWEIHDRIIGATASYYKSILITKDSILRSSAEVETIW